MPQKTGGGGFAPENYDPKTGKYVKTEIGADGQEHKKIDTSKTHPLEVKLFNGQKKVVFNSNEFNPLEPRPGESPKKRFDKTIVLPLFIQYVDEWLGGVLPEGSEIISQGFGNQKVDDRIGIDYRISWKGPDGKIHRWTYDFKFVRTNHLYNQGYDNIGMPLHLFKETVDGQFLNGSHKNTHYAFLTLDDQIGWKKLLENVESGKPLSDFVSKLKFQSISADSLRSEVFNNIMKEDNLKTLCKNMQDDLKDGYFDSALSSLDKTIELKKKIVGYNEVGYPIEKTYMVIKKFNSPQPWRMYSTVLNEGGFDSGIFLSQEAQDMAFGHKLKQIEIDY